MRLWEGVGWEGEGRGGESGVWVPPVVFPGGWFVGGEEVGGGGVSIRKKGAFVAFFCSFILQTFPILFFYG